MCSYKKINNKNLHFVKLINLCAMGLVSLPALFQGIMHRIFRQQIAREELEVYLDDILVFASDDNEMLRILEETFLNLRKSGLLVFLRKCDLGVTKLVYLGLEINKDGYSADPKKVAGIVNAKIPKTLHGVRSFVGMLHFIKT